jgi:hypothetical protein
VPLQSTDPTTPTNTRSAGHFSPVQFLGYVLYSSWDIIVTMVKSRRLGWAVKAAAWASKEMNVTL